MDNKDYETRIANAMGVEPEIEKEPKPKKKWMAPTQQTLRELPKKINFFDAAKDYSKDVNRGIVENGFLKFADYDPDFHKHVPHHYFNAEELKRDKDYTDEDIEEMSKLPHVGDGSDDEKYTESENNKRYQTHWNTHYTMDNVFHNPNLKVVHTALTSVANKQKDPRTKEILGKLLDEKSNDQELYKYFNGLKDENPLKKKYNDIIKDLSEIDTSDIVFEEPYKKEGL